MAVMPWTVLVIFPVNGELNRRAEVEAKNSGEKAGRKEAKEDGKELVDLMKTWIRLNDVRAGLAVLATGLGVWGMFQRR